MGWSSLSGLSRPPFLFSGSTVEPRVKSILDLDRWAGGQANWKASGQAGRCDDDIR